KLAWCWDQLRQGDLLIEIVLARPDLVLVATLYANFQRHGFSNARLETALRYLIRTACVRSLEFPTWRRLDLLHPTASLGLQRFPRRPEKAPWLAARPEPWTLTDDIAYATTHSVFYITDFGRRPSRLSRPVRDYLQTWLPAWLTIYERQHNWDLFAELVMV